MPEVALQTPPFSPPLHTDIELVTEPDRAVLREAHRQAIRRGVFHSVPDLIDAIEAYLKRHEREPQNHPWTATTDQILEKVRRGKVTLNRPAN